MSSRRGPRAVVPPAVRAVILLGGPTKVAQELGVSPIEVRQWMRSCAIPIKYLRKVAALSKIPLGRFLEYEEVRVRDV